MWVGWAIGGLGLLLGFVYYVKPRKFKRFEYWHYGFPIVNHPLDSLEVQYKGQTVQNPTITVLRLVSSGTDSITAGDFEGNGLTVELQGPSEILSVQIRTVPDSLNPTWRIHGNRVVLEPLLLNREDLIELRMVSDGSPHKIHLVTRIAGIASPQLLKTTPTLFSSKHRLRDRIIIPLGATVILGGWIALIWTKSASDVSNEGKIYMTIISTLLLIFVTSGIDSIYRQSRRWNR